MKKYTHSILGGTFDHFHSGHEHFLHEACIASEKLTIGLTTEALHTNKEFRESIEAWEDRKSVIEDFISLFHPEVEFEIIPLDNIYGTTLTDKNIDVLFVTEQGISNAMLINEKRKEKEWPEFVIVQVELVKGSDGLTISSTRIRKGEIDRQGLAYKKLFTKSLKLSDSLRPEFEKEWGEVLTEDENISEFLVGKRVFTVGDFVTQKTKDLEIKTILSVVDGKVERKILPNAEEAEGFKNMPGEINTRAVGIIFQKVDEALSGGVRLTVHIDGEEDLLALPLMLYVPLLSIVCYGLRNRGMVVVIIDEELKINLKNLAARMSIIE